jgi:hypothetical protein
VAKPGGGGGLRQVNLVDDGGATWEALMRQQRNLDLEIVGNRIDQAAAAVARERAVSLAARGGGSSSSAQPEFERADMCDMNGGAVAAGRAVAQSQRQRKHQQSKHMTNEDGELDELELKKKEYEVRQSALLL